MLIWRMYGKLFEQMYDGTLCTHGPWEALVTFQQLIILSDKDGVVDMTPEAISRRTTIPLEVIKTGLQRLSEPDPESRTPDEEGRRIAFLSDSRAWGWRIVNYIKYRTIRTAEDRKQYMRNYQRQRRAVNKPVNKLTDGKQSQPIAVGSRQYAEAEAKAERSKTQVAALPLPPWLNAETWTAYVQTRPARARKPEALQGALKKLAAFRATGHDANEIVATSLANGWRGLFAPDGKRGAGRQTIAEQNSAAAAEFVARGQRPEKIINDQ